MAGLAWRALARTIIGHGIFLDDHPWAHRAETDDLGALARTGSTVAHCPIVFARRGIALRDFGRYLRCGVNMGIGTDVYPHNMLDEMRLVSYIRRVVSESSTQRDGRERFQCGDDWRRSCTRARRHRATGDRVQGRRRDRGLRPSGDAPVSRSASIARLLGVRSGGETRLCRRRVGRPRPEGADDRLRGGERCVGGGSSARALPDTPTRLGRAKRRRDRGLRFPRR
jgi:hypothetical protein